MSSRAWPPPWRAGAFGPAVSMMERRHASPAVAGGAFTPCVLDEDAPHCFRRSAEEVRAPVPGLVFMASEAEPRFVDEGSGLERLIRSFVRHSCGREPAQFVVDQRQQFGGGVRITLLGTFENARHIAAWFGLGFACVIAHGDRSVLFKSLESASFKARFTAQSAWSYKEVASKTSNATVSKNVSKGVGMVLVREVVVLA